MPNNHLILEVAFQKWNIFQILQKIFHFPLQVSTSELKALKVRKGKQMQWYVTYLKYLIHCYASHSILFMHKFGLIVFLIFYKEIQIVKYKCTWGDLDSEVHLVELMHILWHGPCVLYAFIYKRNSAPRLQLGREN